MDQLMLDVTHIPDVTIGDEVTVFGTAPAMTAEEMAAADGTIYKTAAGTVKDCAQVMLVMGSDAMGQYHPNWKVNLARAVAIQDALAQKWATLTRPLVLRTSRFNQQLSDGMILVEIGTHGNTLQEAITAARIFARTVADMMNS
jgi:stage II sporulation protein P